MPSHKIHVFMDRQLFGRSFRGLHRALDKPYAVFGRKHRVFFHDYWSAAAVAKRVCPGDSTAIEAALFHVYLDQQCSEDKEFHRQLKWLADQDVHHRRSARKKGGTGGRRPGKQS